MAHARLPPPLPKGSRQCNPIQGFCACQSHTLANMTFLLQFTKGWRKNSILPTMWSISFGFAMMISSVVWALTKIKLFWIAYSAQHVASEDRNQSNQGRGVGAWRCQVSIAIEGGIFTASLAFGNCNTPNLSVAFMCVSIFQMSTQRSYSWSQAVAIQHHKQRFTKANGRTPDPWMETMLLSHYHSTSTIYCYYQHCLQGR